VLIMWRRCIEVVGGVVVCRVVAVGGVVDSVGIDEGGRKCAACQTRLTVKS